MRRSSTNERPTVVDRKKRKRTAFPGTETWNESARSAGARSPGGDSTRSKAAAGFSFVSGPAPWNSAFARRPAIAPTTGPVRRGCPASA